MLSSGPIPPVSLENLEAHPHFEMIKVEGGTFWMGNNHSEFDDEKPAHQVTVPGFYMGKYQVTQAVWELVIGKNPSDFKGSNRPVENISWDEITNKFLPRLNEITGKHYRLPSEAEWEYAARGGVHQAPFIYSGSNYLNEVGWYNDNNLKETRPIGLKRPNSLGIYDLSGNVWDWCADVWHENYVDAPKDGSAWVKDGEQSCRVVRGGSWNYNVVNCRVSFRTRYVANYFNYNLGFRLARY